MEERAEVTPVDRMRILDCVSARDATGAADAMRDHIARRKDHAIDAARKAYSRLYVPG